MQILNKCSFDLMTFSYIHKELTAVSKQLTKVEQDLKASVTSEEFIKLKESVDECTNKQQADLEVRKRNKYDRDIEDYKRKQVYRWPRPHNQRGRPEYGSTRRDLTSPLLTRIQILHPLF